MRNLFFLMVLTVSASFSIKKSASLTIELSGFSDNQGVAYVAIYREMDNFPAMDEQYKGKTVSISNKSAKVQFSDLPNEKFAVAVFHDRNKNGVLDKNFFGIPTEAYGFSNNARELFSAPKFTSASFYVKSETTIKINVH